MINTDFSYIRYLDAKKSVDDHFLNRHVLSTMQENLPLQTPDEPLHFLEIGSGIATMIERLVDWGIITNVIYTAVEIQKTFLNEGIARVQTYASENDWDFSSISKSEKEKCILLQKSSQKIEIRLIHTDFFQVQNSGINIPDQDLILAHTVLDIFHLPTMIDKVFSMLKPGSLFYFTMNYDGLTQFHPVINAELDRKIEHYYNESMDTRAPGKLPQGGSKTGSKIFGVINQSGGTLLDSGSSDWVITPVNNQYSKDEKYFMRSILFTIVFSLQGHPEIADSEIETWLKRRLTQIKRGDLTFIAHQLDFVGSK